MQAIRVARQAAPMLQKRNLTAGSGIGQTLYNNVWKKSTISYVTYILVGCVAIEMIFGNVSQSIWDNANKGVSIEFFLFIMHPFSCIEYFYSPILHGAPHSTGLLLVLTLIPSSIITIIYLLLIYFHQLNLTETIQVCRLV